MPDLTRPTSRIAASAVSPDMPAPPACSKDSPGGLAISCVAGNTVSSANVPGGCMMGPLIHREPNTSSPGRRSVTPRPTASTTPATSVPRTGHDGVRNPERNRRIFGTPATTIQSGVFTLVARTRTSTPSSPTCGGSISARRSTRSGAP